MLLAGHLQASTPCSPEVFLMGSFLDWSDFTSVTLMIASLEQVAPLSNAAIGLRSANRDASSLWQRWERLRSEPLEFVASTEFANVAPDDASLLVVERVLQSDGGKTNERRPPVFLHGTPLARACELPLLTGEQERALFRRMNYLKHLVHGKLT